MRISRRLLAAMISLMTVAGLAWLVFSPAALGQVIIRRQPFLQKPVLPPTGEPGPSGTSAQYSAIKLEEKSEFRQIINVARDCIRDKAWDDAVTALQTLLDQKKDYYVQVREKDSAGRETLRWTSVKFEANNLLSSMPVEGLEVYELRVGGKAKALLDQAKKTGDREILGEVALRFLHTKSGMEANDLLATYFLDRGQYFMAALRFEKLMKMNPDWAKVNELALFKAALSFRRAGNAKAADDVWQQLTTKVQGKGGLTIGGDVIALAKLRPLIDEVPQADVKHLADWVMIRGDLGNAAQAVGSPPLLDQILWQRVTISDRKGDGAEERGKEAKTKLDEVFAMQKSSPNNPIMSGFFPIAIGKLAIYRSYLDVRAVALADYVDNQGKPVKAGDIVWKTAEFNGALANVMAEGNLRPTLENWINQYKSLGFGTLLFENSLQGTIASDHRLVYAVDDLAVPAPANMFPYVWQQQQIPAELKTQVMQNVLCAFDLQSEGKLHWRLGNFPNPLNPSATHEGPFADSHFLGVPISVGGKLYVLNEKNQGPQGDADLRLVIIDPHKVGPDGTPHVLDVQNLGWVQQTHRITHDMSRRTNAVHLAYGEGILVCPTGAGEVLGVDLMSRSLAWSYPYREQAPAKVNMPINNQPFPGPFPRPGMGGGSMTVANWKSTPPVIAEGRLIFTAPDASSVHCINLRDGKPYWKKRQMDGDLFLAGVWKGKVLVAGRSYLRGLNLSDGSQDWYVPTGDVPSGQGVASKNIYYLPLSKGEILAVDIEKGIVKAHNRAKSHDNPPGNLLFHEGVVISQTPTSIVAYPQLVARLDLANKALNADPTNVERLVERGELLLADGQVQLAVDDLQKALRAKLPDALNKRARGKLYEALTDLLQVNFNVASLKYLDQYREMCNVPDNLTEQQQRLAQYFRIVGQGREAQGNLVEAFQAYREFGSLPVNREQGVASIDDPMHKVPTNVWLRGRVSTMMANATPQQRLPLENKIAEEWKLVQARKDLDAIRSFVDMFDVPFKVGREARLQLAETIMEKNERGAYLEAELNLLLLRNPEFRLESQIGARALAALAQLEEKKGTADSMKQAAAYYRDLKKEYGAVPVRGNKTGNELFDELATDPRFLPHLEESGPLWQDQKIAARDVPGISTSLPGFIFQPEGELTPLMKQQRLMLDPSNSANPQVRLYDLSSNAVRWTQSLGANVHNPQIFQFLYNQAQANHNFLPNARFRFYQVVGNLAVLQVGTTAYCLNMDNGRILWQHQLLDNVPNQPHLRVQQVINDAEGNLQMIFWNQFNGQRTVMSIGHVGSVQASHVALVTQKGLVVLDPLRGTVLWRKMDVPANTRVFGDDQYLFLVDMGETGAVGVGKVLRAIDGTPVDAPDFGNLYEKKVRIIGRKILAAVTGNAGQTLKLHDIVSGKDLWSKDVPASALVLQTEDENLTGIIDPATGKVVAFDALTGKTLFENTVLHNRIALADLKNLVQPLLLHDRAHFYLALNKAVDGTRVHGGVIANNFANGLRCTVVNGWFLAFFREEGQHRVKGELVGHKKGDFRWHSRNPIENQMIVLEQFENLPIILFSARYNEMINGGRGGNRWMSSTQSLHRSSGKMIYDPGAKNSNSNAQFYAFNIDLKNAAINLIGYTSGVQHYLDDGRTPADPAGAPAGASPQAQLPMQPPLPPAIGIGIVPQFRIAPAQKR